MDLLRIATITLVLGCLAPSPAALAQDVDAVVEAARTVYGAQVEALQVGMTTPEDVYLWSMRWLVAVKKRDPAAADQALGDHLARMEELATKVGAQVDSGLLPAAARAACVYYVAEARLW